jgi:hypothetical protein
LPLHRERTYGKNRRTTVKNLLRLSSRLMSGGRSRLYFLFRYPQTAYIVYGNYDKQHV